MENNSVDFKVNEQDLNSTIVKILKNDLEESLELIEFVRFLQQKFSAQINVDILQLIFGHEKFPTIFYGGDSEKGKKAKLAISRLIFEVAKKNSEKFCKTAYVPLLLSAYNCSMNETDQIILSTLHCFESCNDFSRYRPLL